MFIILILYSIFVFNVDTSCLILSGFFAVLMIMYLLTQGVVIDKMDPEGDHLVKHADGRATRGDKHDPPPRK